jgi:uncharacterized protein
MLVAGAAAFVGATVQSATGFGLVLVLAPALFATLDPFEALTAIFVLSFALNLLVLSDGGIGPVRWRLLAPVLLAAVPGLVLGVVLLEALSKPVLQIAVGVAVVAAALVQLRRRVELREGSLATAGGIGLATGTLTTSIGVSGPPLVLWLEGARVSPAEMRVSLAAAFMALNIGGAAVLLLGADGDPVSLGVLLPLLGLVVAGHVAGAVLHRRLDHDRFSLVVLGLVACTGTASVVAGLAAL